MYIKIAFLVLVSATQTFLYGQTLLDKEIRLGHFTGTTGNLLDQISKQGGFTFAHSNHIDIGRKVTIEAGSATVRTWLDRIFGADKVEYVVSQNKIILRPLDKTKTKSTGSLHTVSGYVRDARTGEALIGVNVIIQELASVGATTNAYGFYSITIAAGNYTAAAQFIGYETKSVAVDLTQNTRIDFEIQENVTQLDVVEVTAEKEDGNVTDVTMGVTKIDMKEVDKIPVIFGEKDILKIIQLRPGIKSAGEGNSGFHVRGGAADQNLILLDEATVYNASHLLGFFSVFNGDALKDVTLYKSGQPAEFGGRLSSVLDIRMKDGNDKKFGVEGGIDIIASRLKLEGPIAKRKGSFMISGRRTYADLFLGLSPDTSVSQSTIYFYDLNAKANYRIDDNNRIYLSGYFGKDVLGDPDDRGYIKWGNATGTVRWNHLFSERMFSNTSLIFSNYHYDIDTDLGGVKGKVISRIQDYNFKQDFQYFPNTQSELKFGFNSVYHRITPGTITSTSDEEAEGFDIPIKFAWNNAAYVSHQWKHSNKFGLEYGVRLSSFSILGPGTFYSYNASGEVVDSTSYNTGEFAKTYFNIEPRVSASFMINDRSSIKTAYERNTQNLHLISNATSDNPTDLWIPSSLNVKPQIGDQVSLGYFRNFRNNTYEFSTEVYYRHLQNQIDYKDGAELNFNENVEAELLFGEGRAYGIEFFLKKRVGRLNGWIGYTLARTEKKIAGINNGQYYPAKQDRTHDISVVGIYELSKKLTLSATWVYYTGNAVTFPSGKYEVDGRIYNYYTERNGYRMPDYHRLDIAVTWLRKKTEKFESSWNFSLYNAYGRQNAYAINFKPLDADRMQAIQTTLFRWVPSISYNFKF